MARAARARSALRIQCASRSRGARREAAGIRLRQAAAITIQRAGRGRQGRLAAGRRRARVGAEVAGARALQRLLRGGLGRAEASRERRAQAEARLAKLEAERSALMIQCQFRGFRGVRELRQLKRDDDLRRRREAATLIQALARGNSGRVFATHVLQLHKAKTLPPLESRPGSQRRAKKPTPPPPRPRLFQKQEPSMLRKQVRQALSVSGVMRKNQRNMAGALGGAAGGNTGAPPALW